MENMIFLQAGEENLDRLLNWALWLLVSGELGNPKSQVPSQKKVSPEDFLNYLKKTFPTTR